MTTKPPDEPQTYGEDFIPGQDPNLRKYEQQIGAESQSELVIAARLEKVIPDVTTLIACITNPEKKFNYAARLRYIDAILRTGNKSQACLHAGVSWVTVDVAKEEDPEFSQGVALAVEWRKDLVMSEVHRRGVEGVIEPVFGRKTDGTHGVVGYKRVYSDSLLTMEAKRLEPAYRDTSGTGGSGEGGGVLIIELQPDSMTPDDDWEDAWNGITIEGEVLVVDADDD